jgi:hypothetical protein
VPLSCPRLRRLSSDFRPKVGVGSRLGKERLYVAQVERENDRDMPIPLR